MFYKSQAGSLCHTQKPTVIHRTMLSRSAALSKSGGRGSCRTKANLGGSLALPLGLDVEETRRFRTKMWIRWWFIYFGPAGRVKSTVVQTAICLRGRLTPNAILSDLSNHLEPMQCRKFHDVN